MSQTQTASPRPMPTANVWFENLPRNAAVELRGTVNQYYVYVGGDTEAVVCWSPNTHPRAQATLDQMVRRTAASKVAKS